MSIINVENLTVAYDKIMALEDVTFKIDAPSINVIIGPNGAGKTTLLKAIMGLVKPMKGRIEVLGLNPVEKSFEVRRLMGYIPQRDKVMEGIPMKVLDVILMGIATKREWPRVISKEDLEAAENTAEFLGIKDLMNKTFNQLSGGQKQKVLLARALISKPKILMLDEPFNGVDVISQYSIMEKLKELRKMNGTTILLVTHDINPMMELAENVMIINRRIIAFGRVNEALNEESLSKAYGGGRIIFAEGRCYSIIGDTHHR
ncbi:MAG: metal ABC transporter ATP-binding protein [Candidatus Verstraetearchaeota archaeon]|jgi:zinc/manganese transport system ATP-binding protein|nr:metal ABC transporter ATP-binding protein [Candidatus Verstraetearchaeota archaeon]